MAMDWPLDNRLLISCWTCSDTELIATEFNILSFSDQYTTWATPYKTSELWAGKHHVKWVEYTVCTRTGKGLDSPPLPSMRDSESWGEALLWLTCILIRLSTKSKLQI
jgi:hypothetical protein